MKKKIWHLSSCSTCKRIIKEIGGVDGIILQDIKSEKITKIQLKYMKNLAGSYEALFSRRAMKYTSMGLKEMKLSEADYERYILEEYTFLKRPVAIIENEIFIGSAKKNVECLTKKIEDYR